MQVLQVGGFLQRIDYVRKYAFGVMCILKDDNGQFPIRCAYKLLHKHLSARACMSHAVSTHNCRGTATSSADCRLCQLACSMCITCYSGHMYGAIFASFKCPGRWPQGACTRRRVAEGS